MPIFYCAVGRFHVGDGKPPTLGDVALSGDRIVAVGRFQLGRIGQEIRCDGMVISPGFIDLHNHSDNQVLRKETRAVMNFVTQGCTTIVTGNCGSGPIEVDAYYRDIEAQGVGVNVAHLIPQGQVRRKVIGLDRRPPTPEELKRMKRITQTAMNDGAWGMSTGLIYVPSANADTDELVEIAKVVADHGGIYASHIRNENLELLNAVREALEIGERAEVPVHISHFKSSGKDSWGLVRVATELIHKARQSGQRVTADQYPYTASSTSLEATILPSWARAGGRTKMLARFDDPLDGKRIQQAVKDKLRETDGGFRLQIARYARRPEWAGKRIAEIAREEHLDPYDLVLQIIRHGGASIVNHGINEQDVRFVMLQPWVATASD